MKSVYFIDSIQNGESLKLWTCKKKQQQQNKTKQQLFKPGYQGVQRPHDRNLLLFSHFNWPPPPPHPHPTPTPPPLPGTSFFQAVDLSMNNSSRGKVCKSILQLSTKETCCIKNGFGFDILPWKGCKCCFDVENKLKVCSLVPIVFSNSKLLDVLL